MTGWQFVGWVLIVDLSIVLTSFAVGFGGATIRAFNAEPNDRRGVVHYFGGTKDE